MKEKGFDIDDFILQYHRNPVHSKPGTRKHVVSTIEDDLVESYIKTAEECLEESFNETSYRSRIVTKSFECIENIAIALCLKYDLIPRENYTWESRLNWWPRLGITGRVKHAWKLYDAIKNYARNHRIYFHSMPSFVHVLRQFQSTSRTTKDVINEEEATTVKKSADSFYEEMRSHLFVI